MLIHVNPLSSPQMSPQSSQQLATPDRRLQRFISSLEIMFVTELEINSSKTEMFKRGFSSNHRRGAVNLMVSEVDNSLFSWCHIAYYVLWELVVQRMWTTSIK